jgi:hypothetical protein
MAYLDLPDTQLTQCTFSILDGTVTTPFDRGISFNITQISDPVWTASVATNIMTLERRQAWNAWKNTLRGGLVRVRMYDVARSFPRAYPDAESAEDVSSGWDGTCAVSAYGTGGSISLSGLPAGYVVTAGDRIGLEQSGRFGYYDVAYGGGGTANGSGALTVTVNPFPHTAYFTTSAVARLWRPYALFRMDWQSWSLPETLDETAASFQAYQVLI